MNLEVIWIDNKQSGRDKEVKDKVLVNGVMPKNTLITKFYVGDDGDFRIVLYEDAAENG